MRKQSVSMLLALFTVLSSASCGNASETDDIKDSTEMSDSTTAEEGGKYIDDLPEDLGFGGKTVTFLYREEKADEFYSDASDGEVVNDALYDSIRSVEERLNVSVEAILRPGHYTDVRQGYMDHIKSSVLAGDDTYDFVDLMTGNSPVMMQDGIFADLTENRYIDLSKPYYMGGLVDKCAIDGKLFFTSGDASLGYLKCAFCMYFNQRIGEEHDIGDLYALVDSGKWTLDKLIEITAVASRDINGDGKFDENDRLGFVVHDNNHPWGLLGSTGSVMYSKSAGDEWTFTYGSERDADVCSKIYKLFFTTQGGWFPDITNGHPAHLEQYNGITSKFVSGETFIMTAEVDDSVNQLRDMKDDYGILPYPKYDETQKDYISISRSTHNAFSMPVTCSDKDMAGAVLEALSSSNHEKVLPAYYETALKKKYSRDDDSARMYDLITSGLSVDFGYVYNNAIGSPVTVFGNSYRKENSFASNLAKAQNGLETSLGKYLEKLRSSF